MTLIHLIFYIFIILGVLNFIHLGMYIVGANVYDIKQFRQARKPLKRLRNGPLVSVLIPAHNEEKAIIRCLESVRKSTYRKLQIIIINDASTDSTARLVREYMAQYPTRPFQLISRRKNAGKAAGLNYALRNHVKGDLVMTLDADSILDRHAICRAVRHFEDSKIVGVAANVRIMDSLTVLGILQKFEHMIGYRSKKFYSVTNSEFIIGGVASTYRFKTLKSVKYYDTSTATEDIGLSMKIVSRGNRDERIIYAANVVAQTEGVQTFKALLRQRYRWKLGSMQVLIKYRSMFGSLDKKYSPSLTVYRVPTAFVSEIVLLTQPFMLAYVIFLTILLGSTQFVLGAYLTITLYILWTIWPDEHSTFTNKLKMSLFAPAMYFIFYIMDFIQVVSIVRCLAKPKELYKPSRDTSTWVSPERLGGVVSARA